MIYIYAGNKGFSVCGSGSRVSSPSRPTLATISIPSPHPSSEDHGFAKPNDVSALNLMNAAATYVMRDVADVVLAFGESDEFSFVIDKDSTLFDRRGYKITSSMASLFTAAYLSQWPAYFPDQPLKYPPTFDARPVVYPTDKTLRDYLAWRQVDTHVNNQYNTCFWALVHGGKSRRQAQAQVR